MRTTQISRRRFLLGAAAGSTAVAGALVAQSPTRQSDASQDKAPSAPSGYRLTEHIQNYYRTTRI
jgi:hypothetical protein